MEKLNNLLMPGGFIYITTPNASGLLARIQKHKWREARKPFHLIFFNSHSLIYLMNTTGFAYTQVIKYSPLTSNNPLKQMSHRVLQFFRLYGGLRAFCYKRS